MTTATQFRAAKNEIAAFIEKVAAEVRRRLPTDVIVTAAVTKRFRVLGQGEVAVTGVDEHTAYRALADAWNLCRRG